MMCHPVHVVTCLMVSAPRAGVVCGTHCGYRDGDLRLLLDALLHLDAAYRATRAPYSASHLQVTPEVTICVAIVTF